MVDDAAVMAYQELKLKKAYKFVLFRVADDKKSITLEKTVATATYQDFIEAFPKDQCRYAVYDFDYVTPDGPRNKLLFYVW